VPGKLAHSVPPRRSQVIRVSRAGSTGQCGPHPLHKDQRYGNCITETISAWNQVYFFRKLSISRTTFRAARLEIPKAM